MATFIGVRESPEACITLCETEMAVMVTIPTNWMRRYEAPCATAAGSTPTTVWPVLASKMARFPVPQPTSSTRPALSSLAMPA